MLVLRCFCFFFFFLMKIPWPPRRGVRLNSKPLGKEGRLFTIGFILNLSLYFDSDQYQTHLWRQFELYCNRFSPQSFPVREPFSFMPASGRVGYP